MCMVMSLWVTARTLDWNGLKGSGGIAAVIDAADAQFPTADDLLKRVIAAGRAISVFGYGVVGAVADQAAAHKGDFRDREPGSIQPGALHRSVVSGHQLIGLHAGESPHIEMNGFDHRRGVFATVEPFIEGDQQA